MLITFSGLDGSGKSTLIEALRSELAARSFRVRVLTMYDDVSFYCYIRKLRGLFQRGSRSRSKEVKTSDAAPAQEPRFSSDLHDPKIDVSDKSDPLTRMVFRVIRSQIVRKLFLFLDLASLLAHRLVVEKLGGRVLIMDRYLYDSLADVSDLKGKKWLFVKFFLLLVPKPDAPIFVDVPAETAYARKKEYPIPYMNWRRATYRRIFGWIPNSLVLSNNDLDLTVRRMKEAVAGRIPGGMNGR